MKERSFYVVNLDNKRLMIVAMSAVALMAGFFAFGYRIGQDVKKPAPLESMGGNNMALIEKDVPPNFPGSGNPASAGQPSQPNPLPGDSAQKPWDKKTATPQYQVIDLNAPSKPAGSAPQSTPGQKPGVLPGAPAGSQGGSISPNDAGTYEFSPQPEIGKKPSKQKPAAKGGKKYTIQIAAFKTKARANKAQARLKKKGFNSYIVKSSKYYFVRNGKSGSKDALKKRVAQIKQKTNYEPIILKSKL